MKRRELLKGMAALVGAPALVVSGVARGQDAQQNWSDIEKAANQEGAVTLYHVFSPSGMPDVIAEFNKAYPKIRVTELRLASQQFYGRFETEYKAGKLAADVCVNSMDDRIRTWDSSGWLAKWAPPEVSGLPENMRYGNSMWAVQLVRQAIAYNTNLVLAADAPKEWTDLLDPKWKNNVGISPPWIAIGPLQAIHYLETKFGLSNTAERFKDVGVRFFEGAAGLQQALVRGDVEVAQLADLLVNPALEDGAPIAMVYPKSGVVFTSIAMFVPQPAVHPNAGRVLANWLISKNGQIALQKYSGASGSRADIDGPGNLPANRDLTLIDGDATTPSEDRRRIVEEWKRVFNAT
jgi:iron(III) transport system substrate-binding protein